MKGTNMRQNISASFIVFLVALPLCLGIAVASGVSPEKGVISGVIGGIVVGLLGGAPLQVSGPANSLIVIVSDAVSSVGLSGLELAIALAGMAQIAAGFFGAGRLAKFFPAAVTQGLMTGFAVLIFASQMHVMFDSKPAASFVDNIHALPSVMFEKLSVLANGDVPWGPIFGIGSFAFLIFYNSFHARISGALKKVPPALIVVFAATLIATIWELPLKRVHVPDQLVDDFTLPTIAAWTEAFNFRVFEIALTIFILASTESLLSASAVDQLKPGHVTNYNRELAAQGIGNFLCGILGALPIAGVVIRSTANISAGATSRFSSVLHGVWLLGMVALFPFILDDVPMAILGAILVFSVIRLINIALIAELARMDRWVWPMYVVTAVTVLIVDPMTGVALGIGMQVIKSFYPDLIARPAIQNAESGELAQEASVARDKI